MLIKVLRHRDNPDYLLPWSEIIAAKTDEFGVRLWVDDFLEVPDPPAPPLPSSSPGPNGELPDVLPLTEDVIATIYESKVKNALIDIGFKYFGVHLSDRIPVSSMRNKLISLLNERKKQEAAQELWGN